MLPDCRDTRQGPTDDRILLRTTTGKEPSCLLSFLLDKLLSTLRLAGKKAGLYKVIRQMPEEEQAADLKYRIKSKTEAYERNVLECHLSSDVSDESDYPTIKLRLSQGSRSA